jgi:hypothetical protein
MCYGPHNVNTIINFKLGTYNIEDFAKNNWSLSCFTTNSCQLVPTITSESCSYDEIDNMFDIHEIYLPNVREITICSKSELDIGQIKLRSLPKLSKVVFEQYESTLIETFNFIKENKITHVVYNNCSNIAELELIKNYFQTNNYKLEITKNKLNN